MIENTEKFKQEPWHSRGQRFDPAYLHQKRPEIERFQDVFPMITGIVVNPQNT